jgi:hypothetical protein
MNKQTPGRRVDVEPHLYEPGDYGRWQGEWYGQTPNDLLAGLAKHEVVEHADGTITADPSIEVKGQGYWHGFLEGGVWREC